MVLRSELTRDLSPVIGDRVQLQQVVLNLLLNAAEAMRDVGTGVDPQSAGRIFDAFYTTTSAGMGIGLSVSRSIVERREGRLWVEPNDGPGATFAFSVPCRRAGAPDAAAPPTGAEPIPRYDGEATVGRASFVSGDPGARGGQRSPRDRR